MGLKSKNKLSIADQPSEHGVLLKVFFALYILLHFEKWMITIEETHRFRNTNDSYNIQPISSYLAL